LPLDYDTLRATSTASGIFGAGFPSPCIHLRSTVVPLNWRRLRSDRSHSPAAPREIHNLHRVQNCSPRCHAPVTITR
jgi:hypothetical protein